MRDDPSVATAPGALQSEIEAKGLEIFALMKGSRPAVFSHRNIVGQLLDWSMRNPALKVELFRFVDVLPSLRSSRDIAGHAHEYLGHADGALPAPVRWAVKSARAVPWLTAFAAKRGVEQIAKTFILAADSAAAVPKLRRLRETPLAFTADILGETVVSEREAEAYQARYLELIETLAREARTWRPIEQIDRDDRGDLPRVNVSVKISALYSQIHPTSPDAAIEHLARRLRPLLLRAKELGVFINFDMESAALKDVTLRLFKQLLDEPGLDDYAHAGIALQAYLHDSERDLSALIDWSRQRGRPITVRLIKGAYWDHETVLARQRGWPIPVFQQKPQTDANYERLTQVILENCEHVRPDFGTHSVRSIASCIVRAQRLGVPKAAIEFQMLYGMAEPIKLALVKMGFRVRDYCPIGEVLPGMSYLVRRLLENTSNEGFLSAAYAREASPRDLLRDPAAIASARAAGSRQVTGGTTEVSNQSMNGSSTAARPRNVFVAEHSLPMEPLFENEPPVDFTIARNRQSMSAALVQVRARFGKKYPLIIGGRAVSTDRQTVSTNPSRPDEVVGIVSRASRAEAGQAVCAATNAFTEWSRSTVDDRARVLERAAQLMRAERFELMAWEVFETGKTWIESDADVAEAIDFCDFYAGEMRRLAGTRYVVPGEASVHHYIPRGNAAIIAPWNFPLAILCGMTTAALVAGNCVLIKPSEQSVVIGALFMDILRRAGVPAGVANFVPGAGSEAGAFLVSHPNVPLIAFTGSREVGLKIWETAGRTAPGQKQLKKVICEMGGKNAMIIDADADLDEAIPAIVHSAFGYQGQKCSALSRLIVHQQIYGRLLDRLLDATASLKAGYPEEPDTAIGPVIDRLAYERIREYIELGKREAVLAFQGTVPETNGFFIPPTIFRDVAPDARIAQEEIFGPVLCVIQGRDLDAALEIANGTDYALTGGFFSRSPAHIQRVKNEFHVGNLYVNRGITGAIVARHPFGGFKMSGGGTKAGGRDYLLNFMFPRVVTENRMRRGFSAYDEAGGSSFSGE